MVRHFCTIGHLYVPTYMPQVDGVHCTLLHRQPLVVRGYYFQWRTCLESASGKTRSSQCAMTRHLKWHSRDGLGWHQSNIRHYNVEQKSVTDTHDIIRKPPPNWTMPVANEGGDIIRDPSLMMTFFNGGWWCHHLTTNDFSSGQLAMMSGYPPLESPSINRLRLPLIGHDL